MTVTFDSEATLGGYPSTTSHSVTIPAGADVGDVMVAWLSFSSTAPGTITPPADWSLWTSDEDATNGFWSYVYTKGVESGDPSSSETWTSANASSGNIQLWVANTNGANHLEVRRYAHVERRASAGTHLTQDISVVKDDFFMCGIRSDSNMSSCANTSADAEDADTGWLAAYHTADPGVGVDLSYQETIDPTLSVEVHIATVVLSDTVQYLDSGFSDSSGTSLTLTTPSGVREGDLLLAFTSQQAANARHKAPEAHGWGYLGGPEEPTWAADSFATMWRFCETSEPTTHTFTSSSATAHICGWAVYRGVDRTRPIDQFEVDSVSSGTTSHTMPSVSPDDGYGTYVYGIMTNNATTAASSSTPTGNTEREDRSGTGDAFALYDYLYGASPGALSGTVTTTASTDSMRFSIALSHKRSGFPEIRNFTTKQTSGTGLTIDNVDDVEEDDLLLFFAYAGFSTATYTTLSGWTLEQGPQVQGDTVGYVFSKTAGASESSTYAWTGTTGTNRLGLLVCVKGGVLDGSNAASHASGSGPTGAAVTPSEANTLVLSGVALNGTEPVYTWDEDGSPMFGFNESSSDGVMHIYAYEETGTASVSKVFDFVDPNKHGTSAANQASVSLTAVVRNAVTVTNATVTATQSAATGLGLAPTPTVKAIATQSSATGAGQAPTPSLAVTSTQAAATGAGLEPVPSLALPSAQAAATGTGQAPVPAITVTATMSSATAAGEAPMAGPTQYLYPTATITVNDWRTEVEGTDLHTSVDETSPNDSDYIYVSPVDGTEICELQYGGYSDPGRDDLVQIEYRYGEAVDVGETVNLTVRLIDTTTVIASQTHTDIGGSIVDGEFQLTTAQIAAITDWDLRVRFEAVVV